VVFVLTLVLTRYVSVSSITAAVSVAALAFLWDSPREVAVCATAVAALVIYKHRANIERLLQGTENRLGARR
jgi:glycerol-3-phosphate acyltransferase PlsY